MAKARMLSTKAGSDPDLNSMSIEAELIFLLTIPHLDRDGLISGDPIPLWGKVAPRRVELMDKMPRIIQEWVEHNLVMRYEWKDGFILFFTGFRKHNINMTYEREPESDFPPPPGFRRVKNIGLIPNDPEMAGRLAETIGDKSIYHAALVEASKGTKDVDITLHVKSMKNTRKVRDEVETEVEDEQEVETEVKENDNDKLRALAREEGTFVGVVGLDELLSEMKTEQVMALYTWCWLYNGWNQDDAIDQQTFRDRYKRDPFKGMDDAISVIVSNARKKIMAPLCAKHQEDMKAALQPAVQ